VRDLKSLTGPKVYVDSITDALALVRAGWAGATMQGSVGAYGFRCGGRLVAEAWVHHTRPGWWLRVLPPPAEADGQQR